MDDLTPEMKKKLRNAKNSERIKKLYHDDEAVRNKMKENSKRRYEILKAAVAKSTASPHEGVSLPDASSH
jgi:hypothetical protein